jgi:hypothetical protein
MAIKKISNTELLLSAFSFLLMYSVYERRCLYTTTIKWITIILSTLVFMK